MIRKILGLAPQETDENTFIPSKFALKIATSPKTNYQEVNYSEINTNTNLKIMMICTEERNLKMKNGSYFSTGNHPVEMMVPMLHLIKAGFDVDIYTPTGKPAQIEMWAFPERDDNVKSVYTKYKQQFESPKSLAYFVENEMESNSNYVAIFIPGGHGAMLGLPTNLDLSKLIHWSHNKNLFMLSICHGPAALLASSLNTQSESFLYKGYKMAAFPDAVDKQTPKIGYMPGYLTWEFGKKLHELGVEIINKKADKTCCVDKNLITAASPNAANDFGKMAAQELLKKHKGN